MESKIINQESNPFLEREEFLLEIINESAPTKDEVIAELGKDVELTVIKKIHTNFGKHSFIVDVVVYNSVEAKDKYMVIPKKTRLKMEKEKLEREAEEKKKKDEEAKAAVEAEAVAKEAEASNEETEEEVKKEIEEKNEETEKPDKEDVVEAKE